MKLNSTKMAWICIAIMLTTYTTQAQECGATGASTNSGIQTVLNIKTDFGAIGDGVANDHQAFKNAAAAINLAGGNTLLVIPSGTYLVGKQTSHITTASYYDPVYEGETVMDLYNVNNVTITGSSSTYIVYKDSLHFGTFDTSNGAVPSPLDLYNPSAAGNSNPGADYSYAGTIGNFLNLTMCSNIEVTNLDIDGNSDQYILGGNWGLGNRPIELANSYGINLYDCWNITVENMKIHHFGTDNLVLASSFTNDDPTLPVSQNMIFSGVNCDYAGRNNFSWLGGKNICVQYSSFNYAATLAINTAPGYGMDIEPEGVTGTVSCTDGFFYNNEYLHNASLGLTAGTSRDNPDPLDDMGYGYSYNHYFKKCLVVAAANGGAVHNYINRITFDSCSFYGNFLNYGMSPDSITAPCVIKNSFFSDCYNGYQPSIGQASLSLVRSYYMQLLNCQFDRYYTGYIYSMDGDPTVSCSDDSYKPLFDGNTFNYFVQPTLTLVFGNIGRNIQFSDNNFYKANSANIQWYNITGCAPGTGEGCTDLGNGLQYHTWSENYAVPTCEGGLEGNKQAIASHTDRLVNETLRIYPNPGYGLYTLQVPANLQKESFTITVQDINGKIVQRKQVNSMGSNSVQIEMPAQAPPGMYICTLYGQKGSSKARFIKQ